MGCQVLPCTENGFACVQAVRYPPTQGGTRAGGEGPGARAGYGVGPHTDSGLITLLVQDDVGGERAAEGCGYGCHTGGGGGTHGDVQAQAERGTWLRHCLPAPTSCMHAVCFGALLAPCVVMSADLHQCAPCRCVCIHAWVGVRLGAWLAAGLEALSGSGTSARWVAVPPRQGAIVVNLGELLQAAT